MELWVKATGWMTEGDNMELTHKLVEYLGKGNSVDLALVSGSSGVRDHSSRDQQSPSHIYEYHQKSVLCWHPW